MRHILVGGDGFVGRYLARELLTRGNEVIIYDIKKSDLDIYNKAKFVHLDITIPSHFSELDVNENDVVHHLVASLLVPIIPRKHRHNSIYEVNYYGTKNLLEDLHKKGCKNVVYLTTDMTYGHAKVSPRTEDHPQKPLGPYGGSKLDSEKLCYTFREKGMNITIFRPRLIIGAGRLELLEKLFRQVDSNLPVPTIGNGKNRFPFVSVYDCVDAMLRAVEKGFPNSEYNLATATPPTVNELLQGLIDQTGSKSFLVHTPAWLIKATLTALDYISFPIMDPEQFLIANENCNLDVSKANRELGWVPQHQDEKMLIEAYNEYKVIEEKKKLSTAEVESQL